MNIVASKIQPQPESETAAILSIVARAASDPSVDIDKLERLMQMQERALARQSEQAFNDAMNRAQSHMGRIATNKKNNQTGSRYADYAALDRELRPLYTQEGFSLSFGTAPGAPEGEARIVCHVSHCGGHTRTYQVDMPVDGKGAKGNDVMTKTHAMGAGMSYGMRYLLKMIFNVAIGEDDNDGNRPPNKDAEKIAKWLGIADALTDYPEYLKQREALVKDFGFVEKVPAQVKTAFANAKSRTEPRD